MKVDFHFFILFFICWWHYGLSKTICTRHQYSISDTNFYQRIELPTAVACVERCIENADYCKSVIYVEQRETRPMKRFCQLYGVNSESKNAKVKLEANYEPKLTFYEIVDSCPDSYGTRGEYDEDITSKIGTSLKKILDEMPKDVLDDYGSRTKEVDLTVNDDKVHRPNFDHRSGSHVSGSSYRARPDPFSSRHMSSENDDMTSFHAERDPVPIQPVAVLHAGQPQRDGFGGNSYLQPPMQAGYSQPQFGQQQGRQFPCFSPQCRQQLYQQPPQTPCRAIRRGDPCAPKPRCGPPPLPPCEAYVVQEKVVHVPAKPYWTEWSPSGTCSVTCGHGVRQRRRFCSSGHETDCDGDSTLEEPCELPECNIWSDWGVWSPCSASCGGGGQQRSRYCRNGNECSGPGEEQRTCAEVECPHWASWSSWHECSASCGPGLTKRMRDCLPLGSFACLGQPQEHQSCELRNCPEWGPWQQWTECTKSCDGGERQRIRECLHGSDCKGPAEEHILCNQQPCPVWSPWSYWSQCSQTCGDDGTRLRTRTCQYEGFPSNLCEGSAQDQSACQLEECPFWDEWASWSVCSSSCGHGQQTRARKCEPRGYGCQGGDKELKFCQLAVCPFYDEWSEWGGCSVTCGRGHCERSRKCVKNDPLPGAVLPSEDELEEGNGRAEDATDSNRKAALRGRLIARARGINDQESRKRPALREQKLEVAQSHDRRRLAPRKNSNSSQNSDLECSGPAVDRKECDAGPCCDWSGWASWSPCNAACGTGSKVRSRVCQVDVGYSTLLNPGTVGVPGNGATSSFGSNFNYQVDPNFGRSWGQQNGFGQQYPSSIQPISAQVNLRGKRQAWNNLPPRNPMTYVTPSPFYPQPRPSDPRCDCDGPALETEICTKSECVEPQEDVCSWSAWSEWCGCSGNCQQGVKARTRYCNKGSQPRSGRFFDPCDCPGDKVQTSDCVPDRCDSASSGTGQSARPRGAQLTEKDASMDNDEISISGFRSMVVKKAKNKHRTDEDDPEDFIIKDDEEEEEEEDNPSDDEEGDDEVTSCHWSEWSDWSKCGIDFLKQRNRFCVGLKALINNCECRGSNLEQTSCRPTRDGHNFKPPTNAVLAVSRDILHEKLHRNGHQQHDDPSNQQIPDQPVSKIRPISSNPKIDNFQSGPRFLSGSEIITSRRAKTDNVDEILTNFEDAEFPQQKSDTCAYNEWEKWSKCDVECGEGERKRSRTCPCETCPGVGAEIEVCIGKSCPDRVVNPFD